MPRASCGLLLTPQQRKLVALGSSTGAVTVIRGRLQNIGKGGFTLLTRRPIYDHLVRCEIEVFETRATIPTPVQVRWV